MTGDELTVVRKYEDYEDSLDDWRRGEGSINTVLVALRQLRVALNKAELYLLSQQTPSTLKEIWGKYPGDESIEEILSVLREEDIEDDTVIELKPVKSYKATLIIGMRNNGH